MNKKIILTVVLVLTMVGALLAQSERLAFGNLRKNKWDKTRRLLEKAKQKDSVNTPVFYVYACYFISIQNPDYQIDSASIYNKEASLKYNRLDVRQREKLKRFPLDSLILSKQRKNIDSAAFERAKTIDTEKAYLHFIENFPNADQQPQAISLRDIVAYQEAEKINTYQSFLKFITNYPNARQKEAAHERYEKLLYETLTADGQLETFERFLRDYPETPYRKNTEQNIFELSTASGSEADYIRFIEGHSESVFTSKAKNILFYILAENDHDQLHQFLPGDSLNTMQQLDQSYLIPIYAGGKYGFMDEHGNEIIKPRYDGLPKEYMCGNVNEDFIILSGRILTRNDKTIFTGGVQDVNDLGYGFLDVGTDGCRHIVHKTGFVVGDSCYTRGKILAGKFIALQAHNQWSLWSLTGRKLFSDEWDDLSNIKDVIVFKKNSKYKLATAQQIGLLVAKHRQLILQDAFDEIKPWMYDQIWTRVGDYQGLLNQSLGITLPFENHALSPSFFGTISTFSTGRKIYLPTGDVRGPFKNIKVNDSWVAVHTESTWALFDPERNHYLSAQFDSITFIGPFSVGHAGDTARIYFNPQNSYAFKKCTLEFVPDKDSTAFLVVNDGDKKSVYNAKGQRLFTGKYDRIQYAGDAMFVVTKKDKKGLVSHEGKLLLPCTYDAIGGASNHAVSLLDKLKFGVYDVLNRQQIKPQYDKNLSRYSDKILIAYKDGLSGFIDESNNPIGKFEFEEIMYWNDTTAFVKNNFQWKLYSIYRNKTLISNIKSYKIVTDSKDEKIFIVNLENEFGVISNKRGTILPFTFNGIRNLGSADDPFYLTEKHVEEASVFIVMYYNKDGVLIRKQVYEEEEYEQIYCSE